jgi:hypothetical protein
MGAMYFFRDVVEDVGFQAHFHIYCTDNPAELALPDVKNTIYHPCPLFP